MTSSSPASSLRWISVGAAVVGIAGAGRVSARGRRGSDTRAAPDRGAWRSTTARMARMCSAFVPQHPPTIRAPEAIMRAAYSAMYAGEET